jgi:TRAP-type C4-dicarboxylate transport system substrate-binding protein
MKRIGLMTVLAVALMVLPSMAFAGGQKDGAAKASGSKITITFAGTEAATTTQSKMMQAVADALNADGRFDAKVLVAGALSGDTNALVTQAKLGVPLVVPTDPGRLASQFAIPDLNILMAPYVLTDPAVLKTLPNTDLFKDWSKQLEAQGIVMISDMYNGFRNFYTVKPVLHVKDLSNMRIRGFGNDIGNSLAKYFGFANIAISFSDVFTGIQQNTLDGTEVQVSAAAGAAFWDVTKNIAMTKHYMLQTTFVCSTRLLSGMPADAREFFLKTMREKTLEYGAMAQKDEAAYYDQMKQHGVTINEVDIKEFKDAIAPLYTNNDLKFSPGLKDKLFKQLGI